MKLLNDSERQIGVGIETKVVASAALKQVMARESDPCTVVGAELLRGKKDGHPLSIRPLFDFFPQSAVGRHTAGENDPRHVRCPRRLHGRLDQHVYDRLLKAR